MFIAMREEEGEQEIRAPHTNFSLQQPCGTSLLNHSINV
jgi:hypothetical protein